MAEKEATTVFYNPASLEAKARQDALLEDVQRRRAARSLALPTADDDVKSALRAAGRPITLFGEDSYDRRERLRAVLSDANHPLLPPPADHSAPNVVTQNSAPTPVQDFFTDGSAELADIRHKLVVQSLKHSAVRVDAQRKRFALISKDGTEPHDSVRKTGNQMIEAMHSAVALASTVGDARPLACCAIDNTGQSIATGSWGGSVKVWDRQGERITTLKTHQERISSLSFRPHESSVLATASADKSAVLHRLGTDNQPNTEVRLEGHVDRVADVAWHPFASLVATASYDSTWRLWDPDQGKQILLQEGHIKPVYRVAFHPDGGVAASTGLDCGIFLWDLRSGMCISSFTGHMDQVLGLDFSSDGFHLASGGGDNTIRIWDLRKRKTAYVIPAHSNLVSSLRFQKNGGHTLVSSSYDRTCKVWSKRGWLLVRAFTSFEEKVTCVDVSDDGQTIVASCFDKTWKLWGTDTDR